MNKLHTNFRCWYCGYKSFYSPSYLSENVLCLTCKVEGKGFIRWLLRKLFCNN